MLLDIEEINRRLDSPINLIRDMRAKRTTHETLVNTPIIIPKSEEIIPDIDKKISRTSSQRLAGNILNKTLQRLENSVDELEKPEQLARVAKVMGNVIESLEEKALTTNDNRVQFVIFKPEIRPETEYDAIEVAE